MPSTETISSTDFTSFVAKTLIESSKMNNNFNIYRGHVLPVETNTSTAADNSYDLGGSTYRWRAAYSGSIDLRTSTSTASLVMQGQTGNTLGSFEWLVGGSTVGALNTIGFKGDGSQLTGVSASDRSATAVSASFNVTTTMKLITVDASGGTITATMVAANGNSGREFIIKKTDTSTNEVLIQGDTTTTLFDGATATTVNIQYESLHVASDGTNWQILDRKYPKAWTSYTPTMDGFGTIASVNIGWIREGQNMRIMGSFQAGTVTATTGSLDLPSGYSVDANSVILTSNTNTSKLGFATDSLATPQNLYGTGRWKVIFFDGSNTSNLFFANAVDVSQFTKGVISSIIISGQWVNVEALIPISGWKG